MTVLRYVHIWPNLKNSTKDISVGVHCNRISQFHQLVRSWLLFHWALHAQTQPLVALNGCSTLCLIPRGKISIRAEIHQFPPSSRNREKDDGFYKWSNSRLWVSDIFFKLILLHLNLTHLSHKPQQFFEHLYFHFSIIHLLVVFFLSEPDKTEITVWCCVWDVIDNRLDVQTHL